MISTEKANEILNDLFRPNGTSGVKYLGFSTTEPSLSTSGTIDNFAEPADSTGYIRLELGDGGESLGLNAASGAKITNTKYNLSFPVPDKGKSYGSAVAIGFFGGKTGGAPYFVAKLKEPVALGTKATLVIYKNDFTTTLTATETTNTATTEDASGTE